MCGDELQRAAIQQQGRETEGLPSEKVAHVTTVENSMSYLCCVFLSLCVCVCVCVCVCFSLCVVVLCRQSVLKWNGWGYRDSYFKVNSQGQAEFHGRRSNRSFAML